ncbi:alpha/beta hydrolase [Pseudofrankia asymbiotica]|uniref:Esterase n=1 Tax=Pseudofrankia asymbiotica TaxID=1834516 RepID=A0A1V2I380_9ACTN|nr:alpha/beta hydrolase-fold protein [Pseudofrankia asymbiotica]ONH23295.1 esterase [Pseudofrankia asymbiotica]
MTPCLTHLIEAHFGSASVRAPVDFRVLLPSDWDRGESLPLVLHLHGAMSSSASLELARPLYDELWRRGELPRAVVACPSTPTAGGFYLDWPDAAWETLIAHEFPEHVAKIFGPFKATALIGASMGGYGALKVAFAAPERFDAVAAVSPAVFPGEEPRQVPARNIPSVLGELHAAMAGGAGDAAAYAANSVYGRLRANADAIRAARLPILIDCGAADEFLLNEGADYLHGVLLELDIAHIYRLVEGAGHVGPAADRRTLEAIRFIGTALTAG